MTPVCPKCDQPLFLLRFHGTALDYCNQCRGLWLDAGELEEIVAGAGAEGGERLSQFLKQDGEFPAGHVYPCPRCDRPMKQVTVRNAGSANLVVERCVHGIWFDADELERLVGMCLAPGMAGKVAARVQEFFVSPESTSNNNKQGGTWL
jgi:Zn-finger nucleic acid-binding protein